MKAPKLYALLMLLTGSSASPLEAAETFAIQLSVQAGARQQAAGGRSTAVPSAAASRPVLTAPAGTRLRVRWSVSNQEESGRVQDITVHVVLDKETAVARLAGSKPGPDVVYESALVTDIAARGTTSGDFVVEPPEPGDYVLLVETIGAARTGRDEYAAAITVRVAR
jgi:hypothetical protein